LEYLNFYILISDNEKESVLKILSHDGDVKEEILNIGNANIVFASSDKQLEYIESKLN
jgi:hypothetical protein